MLEVDDKTIHLLHLDYKDKLKDECGYLWYIWAANIYDRVIPMPGNQINDMYVGSSAMSPGLNYIKCYDGAFNVNSNSWTIEFMMYINKEHISDDTGPITFNENSIVFTKNGIKIKTQDGSFRLLKTNIIYNSWFHWAVCKRGNLYYTFINGLCTDRIIYRDNILVDIYPEICLGLSNTWSSYKCCIEHFRISNVARYDHTKSFDPDYYLFDLKNRTRLVVLYEDISYHDLARSNTIDYDKYKAQTIVENVIDVSIAADINRDVIKDYEYRVNTSRSTSICILDDNECICNRNVIADRALYYDMNRYISNDISIDNIDTSRDINRDTEVYNTINIESRIEVYRDTYRSINYDEIDAHYDMQVFYAVDITESDYDLSRHVNRDMDDIYADSKRCISKNIKELYECDLQLHLLLINILNMNVRYEGIYHTIRDNQNNIRDYYECDVISQVILTTPTSIEFEFNNSIVADTHRSSCKKIKIYTRCDLQLHLLLISTFDKQIRYDTTYNTIRDNQKNIKNYYDCDLQLETILVNTLNIQAQYDATYNTIRDNQKNIRDYYECDLQLKIILINTISNQMTYDLSYDIIRDIQKDINLITDIDSISNIVLITPTTILYSIQNSEIDIARDVVHDIRTYNAIDLQQEIYSKFNTNIIATIDSIIADCIRSVEKDIDIFTWVDINSIKSIEIKIPINVISDIEINNETIRDVVNKVKFYNETDLQAYIEPKYPINIEYEGSFTLNTIRDVNKDCILFLETVFIDGHTYLINPTSIEYEEYLINNTEYIYNVDTTLFIDTEIRARIELKNPTVIVYNSSIESDMKRDVVKETTFYNIIDRMTYVELKNNTSLEYTDTIAYDMKRDVTKNTGIIIIYTEVQAYVELYNMISRECYMVNSNDILRDVTKNITLKNVIETMAYVELKNPTTIVYNSFIESDMIRDVVKETTFCNIINRMTYVELKNNTSLEYEVNNDNRDMKRDVTKNTTLKNVIETMAHVELYNNTSLEYTDTIICDMKRDVTKNTVVHNIIDRELLLDISDIISRSVTKDIESYDIIKRDVTKDIESYDIIDRSVTKDIVIHNIIDRELLLDISDIISRSVTKDIVIHNIIDRELLLDISDIINRSVTKSIESYDSINRDVIKDIVFYNIIDRMTYVELKNNISLEYEENNDNRDISRDVHKDDYCRHDLQIVEEISFNIETVRENKPDWWNTSLISGTYRENQKDIEDIVVLSLRLIFIIRKF